MSKVLRTLAIVFAGYVALVAIFETLLGVAQPQSGETLIVTTTDTDGGTSDRVLTRLESEGLLYVAANHWPRRWYREALAHPDVEITQRGETQPYRAVPVTGEEHDRVARDNPVGFGFRFITGFPARKFVRLDPR